MNLPDYITPEEFIRLRRPLLEQIAALEQEILDLDDKAQLSPPPENHRPALPSDIVEGAVIWHENGDDGWHWHEIDEVQHPDDLWKAYVANGCRYGLYGAWVAVKSDEKAENL